MISKHNLFPSLMLVFSHIGKYEETIGAWLDFSEVGKCDSLPKKCTFDHPSVGIMAHSLLI